MNYTHLKTRLKTRSKSNTAQLFLVHLLGLLVGHPYFYFVCPVAALAASLIVDLAIGDALLMVSKIAISLSK